MSIVANVRKRLGSYGIYIALIVIFIFLSCFSESFLSVNNILNLIRQASFNGMLALGATFVIMTGGIDLSVGSTLALTGVIAASFSIQSGAIQLPLGLAVLVGIIVGVIAGLANGLMVTYGKIPPFIATLVTQMVLRGAALVFSNGQPITGYTSAYKWMGQGAVGRIPIPMILFLILIVVCALVLHYTKYGRHVYAVGGNPQAAKASGLRVSSITISTYVISGILAALAGIALSSRVNAASPIAGEGYEADAVAAAVMGGTSLAGGTGSIGGTVAGVFIIAMISNGLDMLNVSSYYQKIVKGIIIFIAVMLDRKKD